MGVAQQPHTRRAAPTPLRNAVAGRLASSFAPSKAAEHLDRRFDCKVTGPRLGSGGMGGGSGHSVGLIMLSQDLANRGKHAMLPGRAGCPSVSSFWIVSSAGI